nr:UPF0481 protein At3g47200-like [Ipomoea batatas]GMD70187.1 UPF0481 protein At3g47200-like [Ipomoea batatas]GME00885.1 UPF0481 protein At3g47200-like [Ipomoea batatas]GME17638.1 UPF0481 protein At3g47200-like [Ipomoea batatas]
MQSNTEAVCRCMKERLKDVVVATTQNDRHCIFKVHDQLRKVNEKCYLPEIMSIGPYHHGQQNLQWIEPHKLRYFNSLLQWNRVSLEKLVNAIMEHESHLREYYAETINLDQVKFTEMVVLDGCFVIELVRKFNMAELRDKDDPIFKMDWVLSSLQRDLILFENQLPFTVLCKLFDLIEAPNQHDRLIYLLCGFVSNLFPSFGYGHGQKTNQIISGDENVKHLLELIHKWWMPIIPPRPEPGREQRQGQSQRRFFSASQLTENGVKLRRSEMPKQISQFNIEFKRGVLWIPTLTIEDRTECVLRNLMAYEQYSKDLPQYFVTNYVKFFSGLIDSPRDVEILRRYGVIDNWLGGSEEVYNMFRMINKSTTYPNTWSCYDVLRERVNEHCNTSLKGRIARLRRNCVFTTLVTESVISI